MARLVLSRRVGEAVNVRVGGVEVVVRVVETQRGKARLVFDAPASVNIWREEIDPEKRNRRPPAARD